MIRALVFDFDGLIVDTETPLIDAWVRVHEQAGVAYAREHALSIIGHADLEYDPWIAFGATADRPALEESHRLFRNELLHSQPVLPGVLNLIQNATSRGIPLGIASNSPHSWVDNHLQRLGLFDHFQTICCRDDVTRGKPEPDVYQAALDALKVNAANAIAFEDSLPGSEAAKRAGLFCVLAPNPSTRHYTFPHADRRVESLAEVTLDALITWMRAPAAARINASP